MVILFMKELLLYPVILISCLAFFILNRLIMHFVDLAEPLDTGTLTVFVMVYLRVIILHIIYPDIIGLVSTMFIRQKRVQTDKIRQTT